MPFREKGGELFFQERRNEGPSRKGERERSPGSWERGGRLLDQRHRAASKLQVLPRNNIKREKFCLKTFDVMCLGDRGRNI